MFNARTQIAVAAFVLSSCGVAFSGVKEDARALCVSGGEDHTLVLTANKWAWACGPNGYREEEVTYYFGVLGTGSTDPDLGQKVLIRIHGAGNVGYLESVCAIDAGWQHSLALDANDHVWSWGWNEEGQLGIDEGGAETYRTTPVQVLCGEQAQDPCNPNIFLKQIIGISAGRSGQHSLAIDANGYAYGWGYNEYGQCGNGESENNKLTPVHVDQGEQVDDPDDPNDWLKHVIDICAGSDQSIALEKDDPTDANFNGCVYTWGTNWWGDEWYEWIDAGYGLLGNGTNDPCSSTPVRVLCGQQHPNDPNQPFLNHIVAVAAGWDHCMALEKDDPYDPNIYNPTYTGRVYTWGNNGQGWGGGPSGEEWERSVGGRLGDGSTDSNDTPVVVLRGEQPPEDPCNPNPNLMHIVAISAGEGHSLALDIVGNVYAWGDNQYGQLGNATNDPCTTPVKVVGHDGVGYLEDIVAISAGHWHSVAIDANGVIWTWGKGSDGRLGLGNKTIDCNTPHPIPVVYNVTQESFAFAIQTAIDEANDAGDTLEASEGTYYENVNFLDKSINLRSTNPGNWGTVSTTIIDGSYNTEGAQDPCYCAVNLNDGSGSSLAGFTISDAQGSGVYCQGVSDVSITSCWIRDCDWGGIWLSSNASANIFNCRIENNTHDGIALESSSSADVRSCRIRDNGHSEVLDFYGIYFDGSSADISVCNITANNDGGIYCDYAGTSGISIKDNWICGNGTGAGCGIYFSSGHEELADVVIRHNTIADNTGYGISTPGIPDIKNCIIWGNGSGSLQSSDYDVTYSCIAGGYTGTGNISSDPCFVDTDANDFHLGPDSLCIDAGDPGFTPDATETDIDGEERVINGRVDMGADEFYWSPADLSGDGIVNFVDYAMLTSYWRDAGIDYNDVFGFGDSNSVSLAEFCDHWLWEAGWLTGPLPMMAGRGAGGMIEVLALDDVLHPGVFAEREPSVEKPVDILSIIKWLEEIWLEAEVREAINKEVWQKFVESLKDWQ